MEIENISEYVSTYLTKNLDTNYLFHNLDRTKDVVLKTKELLEANTNQELDYGRTLVAAWFLHTGFTKDNENHVVESTEIAKEYLSNNGIETGKTEKIVSLIREAWNFEEVSSEEGKILQDAKTAYYASEDFPELIELHRMELSNLRKNVPSPAEWREEHIELLRSNHSYYTNKAKKEWQELKRNNILKLVSNTKKATKKRKKEQLKVKLKNESPERAIQSLYRTQLRNHIKLSDIADTKANILLSVNAIIISLLLANLIPKLDTPKNSYLIYPTVIFVVFSITSMIMSVLATRPKIENENLIDRDLNTENTNFLFFGNFFMLSLPDFKQKMKDIIKTKESIYDSLTMDLYYLGLVLKKKYKLLRWTYTIFMIGIILSVIAFAIALKYYGMAKEILDAVTPDSN